MAAVLIRPDRTRSRLRLFVMQVLMLSLFVTLFGRLWYLQVFTGEEYQAKAAEQSVREVVAQPPRGLIVDAMGRPLVTNRTSWVVSVDRTVLGKLDAEVREALLRKVAATIKKPYDEVLARTRLCGTEGAEKKTCWNGSPFQPIPVANDVPQTTAVEISEQGEEYPGVLARAESVRSYPAPFGINAAGILGYLSPITGDELTEAERSDDRTLNGASLVGRAGLEKSYDQWLRGTPGITKVAVDSMGRVLGEGQQISAEPGETLVTSIDAKVQGVAEKELHEAITNARKTFDPVTRKNYVADSGAVVVLDAKNGNVVAMASQPTYDPSIWVNGITEKQLKGLYSKKNGVPLVSRATQGQFAPGSTWKPFMSVGALNHGFSQDTRLDCSSGLQVGNRWFKNYESASYGSIDFAKALQISCDTFFYRVGLSYWNKYGSDPSNVKAKDPLVTEAKEFGFGSKTGIDIPGEASGRIADRKWKLAYWNSMKDYYCKIDKKNTANKRDFLHVFAHEFCLEGNQYRAGDSVNFSIGQGDTMVTPIQLARAYAAISNGGTLYAPRIAKAIVDADGKLVKRIKPVVQGKVKSSKAALKYVDEALLGTTRTGTLAWRFGGFPLDDVKVRSKTGSAEVYGKQSTSWVATYDKNYVVIMVVTQAGTGSGTSGPPVRKIWEALYGIDGETVVPGKAAIPGTTPPRKLPVFASDGEIMPPVGGR
ncbi:penicillin-binding protein 2 [Nocardioides marmoriginsengisoli]|uniref:Penicillin-binding protein 2 n=1 Tax=Nocardioides marmoriginsengisoli TaxID=661483 RepID=A0A3N0CII6_9ACTN|nr:penicillin-binding protein 2 [Nocardioides marmoriginsengisoli]RNL63288.1 penicillin-binding protein 2 [Nocardioides marmoriginsengisoli]